MALLWRIDLVPWKALKQSDFCIDSIFGSATVAWIHSMTIKLHQSEQRPVAWEFLCSCVAYSQHWVRITATVPTISAHFPNVQSLKICSISGTSVMHNLIVQEFGHW